MLLHFNGISQNFIISQLNFLC